MRRLLPILAIVALPAAAASQSVTFYPMPLGDSAKTLLTGDTGTVEIHISTCSGISAYALRVFYDDSVVTVLDADSVTGYGLPKPTVTPGTGYVDLSASGTGYNSCTTRAAALRLQLAAGASTGSALSMQVTNLVGYAGGDLLPAHLTGLGRVCQATRVWGDPDDTRTITSRDALIVLSAAVGLPHGGFDLSVADIDDDARVTTRDALMILSRAVGFTALRAGQPRTERCDPLSPSPTDIAFFRNNQLWRIAAGDTTPILVGFAPYGSFRPSWKPDGTRILFEQFVSGGATEFLSVTPDGADADTIPVSTSYDYAPSWSPADTLIAFVSDRVYPRALYVMRPDGSNQVQLTLGDSLYVYDTEWTPDGNEIVFVAQSIPAGGLRRLWAIGADGQNLRELTGLGSLTPEHPSVSPAGDSVAFRATNGEIHVMAMAPGTPALRVRLLNQERYTQWLAGGIAFRAEALYPYGYYLRRNDGRIQRFARGVFAEYGLMAARRP